MPRRLLSAILLAALLLSACTNASDGSSRSTAPDSSVASTHAPSSPDPTPATTAPSKTPSSTPHRSSPSPSVPSGLTVALNPGHNGGNAAHADQIGRLVPSGFGQSRACDTTGTETNAGYPEHAFNWDVTLRLRTLLVARGVHVVLTRDSDTGVGPCIDERARIANASPIAAVISIHADGADASGHGFHICEDSRQPAGPQVAAQSHALTVAVHNALVRGSGFVTSTYLGQDGYFPRDDLAGLNLATVPATFAELGNMRNAGDAEIQTSAAGRQRIAQALAAGILAWLATRR